MIRRSLFLLLTAFAFNSANAQDPFAQLKLPQVIPPSPEVAALGKVGALSAGLHTGSANVSIPLYELSMNDFKMPIMLSYSSNGVKVDEIPGRAGLGWNLIAGGVVNRVVHDEPDGVGQPLAPPANPNVQDANLVSYLKSSADYEFDTEQDEYSYSFNGQSGKFFVDALGVGHCIPHNNFKIVVNGFNQASKSVVIWTSDGTRYDFGGSSIKEKTRSITVSGTVNKQAFYEMAWFLTKITTPKGEVINFFYSPITIRTKQGNFQTVIKPSMPQGGEACMDGQLTCQPSDNKGLTILDYDTYYLSSISAGNGINIDFIYEQRPDLSGDTRLTDLIVSASVPNYPVTIKKYGFVYTEPTSNNGHAPLNRRYFLTKLKSYDLLSGTDGTPLAWLEHNFEYDDMNGLGQRLSYAQDFFGYYNGLDGNNYSLYFIPQTTNLQTYYNGNVGIDRNPSESATQKGILKKVTYPTGGTDEYFFEANTITHFSSATSYSSKDIGGSGLNTMDPQTHISGFFTANSNQSVTLYLNCFKSPAFPDAPGNEGDRIYEFKLLNLTTGTTAFYKKYFYYTSESYTVSLVSGNAYQLQVTAWGQVNAGNASLFYNPNVTSAFTNDNVGGLRVKEIRSYDPVSNKYNSKYYKYAPLSDMAKSSGIGVTRTANTEFITTGIVCRKGLAFTIISCGSASISSNSQAPLYTFGGSHVAYSSVIESDDPLFKNGCVEHLFTTYLPFSSGYALVGSVIMNAPIAASPDMNGQEHTTRYYKKSSTGLILLKEVNNYYSEDFRVYSSITNYITRKRWDYPATYSPAIAEEFYGFDLMKYEMKSYYIRLDSTVTRDYDPNGQNPLITKTGYEYSSPTHFAPTKVESYASDNIPVSTLNKYPIDFASGTNAYQAMVGKNQITAVIEAKSFKGTTELTTVKTDYNNSFSGVSTIAPEFIKTQKTSGGSLETRIHFYKYDAGGNPLEVAKEGGKRISYIYDYNNNFPVAEFNNASLSTDSLAYTSFESSGLGYWNFDFNPVTDYSAPSGYWCHNLTNGSITRTINSTKTYFVTYWLKASSGAVSVNGSSATLLSTKNGWNCYRHQISSTSSVTISGTGKIDELRLYPVGAQLTTYAYKPFVGVVSVINPANQLSQYEYDGYNRLRLVRDGDRNILKQYEYAYQKNFTPCSNTTANWVNMGIERCVQTGPNNNYNGLKERQEKDINNCSPTYLQIRWASITPTGCSTTSCSGEGYRIPTGGSTCVPGQQIFIYQTYLDGQWECKYYYYWPQDGYRSQDYISYNFYVCGVN